MSEIALFGATEEVAQFGVTEEIALFGDNVITADSYEEASSANSVLVQNISSFKMRLVFANALPDPDTPDFHILSSEEAIIKSNGIPVGNIYLRMEKEGTTGEFSVAE